MKCAHNTKEWTWIVKQLAKCVLSSPHKRIGFGRERGGAEHKWNAIAKESKWAFNASKRIQIVQLQ